MARRKCDPPSAPSADPAGPIRERVDDLLAGVPEEEFALLPADGSEQHDPYIYGTPKRER